ncbi:hypothetical protein AR275_25705 [Stenotrophomonas maltophilia]|nr:hypothetical protein AR275_25705 [Stenotrophomonas maltophilia]
MTDRMKMRVLKYMRHVDLQVDQELVIHGLASVLGLGSEERQWLARAIFELMEEGHLAGPPEGGGGRTVLTSSGRALIDNI